MSLLTIFTAPKPFSDPHIATIQRNAITSWTRLGSEVEVLLLGDEEGIEKAAAELEVRHIKEVASNHNEVPLISALFETARQSCGSPLLAYVNADILLFPNFVETARKVAELEEKFLLVGRRWDLDVDAPLDFKNGWEQELWEDAVSRGRLHRPVGSDYFIFPRDLFTQVPDFVVGRAGWDNWIIYHASRASWPCIDASGAIKIIHQNHDYNHLPGGRIHYRQEETFQNIELAGGYHTLYTLREVNKVFEDGCIRPARLTLVKVLRRLELLVVPRLEHDPGGLRGRLTRLFRRTIRRIEV